MTAVAVPSPDLRRRVAIALATVAAALLLAAPAPASAEALTYCVAPATGPCADTFASQADALAAATRHKGDNDLVRERDGSVMKDTKETEVGNTTTSTTTNGNFVDDVTNFMLTWLPLIFMGVICLLIGLTMRYMPRTKPQEIKPDTSQSTRWKDVAGAEEAKDELR